MSQSQESQKFSNNKMLDAFFKGAAAPTATDQYRIDATTYNPLALRPGVPANHPFYGVAESCSVLWDLSWSNPLAVYVQERGVALLHLKHEAAPEVASMLAQTDLYNTAETPEVRLYCPIACDDCEMAYKCAVVDDETRCRIAKPRLMAETDGPVFF